MQTPTTVTAVTVGTDLVANLRSEMYARKLTRLTLNGPKGSRAEVYLGQVSPSNRIDQTARGESNTAEYSNPVDIPAGMNAFVVWPKMSGKDANVTFITERG